jgi:hypothetical protein
MSRTGSSVGGGALLALFLTLASPAFASRDIVEVGNYEEPALMHAVLAKVWGITCPGMLSDEQVSEVQAFIDRWVATVDAREPSRSSALDLWKSLERTYLDTYTAPGACAEVKLEIVADYFSRIQAAAADPFYWSRLAQVD